MSDGLLEDERPLREELVAALRRLDALGMNRGSTGNVSHRSARGEGVWITPTGMGADEIGADGFNESAAGVVGLVKQVGA